MITIYLFELVKAIALIAGFVVLDEFVARKIEFHVD